MKVRQRLLLLLLLLLSGSESWWFDCNAEQGSRCGESGWGSPLVTVF